jgi:hypothetical protein
MARASGGTSLVIGRTGGGLGPVPDRHGGDQHGIGSDEGAVADGRPVLAGAVVVDEHGAGADVRPGADVGVARRS